VQASVGITDKADSGTVSTVHDLRETQRSGLARKMIGTSPLISLPTFLHTLHTCTASKNDSSSALPILPSHFDRACALGHLKLASALFVANLDHCGPDGMVWYGMVSLDVCKWGVKNGFWKICLRHNIVDLCDKQDSLMCDTAAFVCSMRRTTLACYKLYWTVQMLMTCDDPAVIDAKARESQFFHTRPHSMTPLTLIVLSRLDRGIQSVGTNLIHDFTAVTFSVKLAFFREKRPFPCFREIP